MSLRMRVAELSSSEKEGEGEQSERDSLASNFSHSSGGSGTAAGLGGEENRAPAKRSTESVSEDEFILLRRKLVDRVGVLLLHEWLPKDCRREATFERPSDSLELWVEPNEQWEAGDERGGVRRFSAAPGIFYVVS